jgi:SAM-dependent methyltransferase
MTLPDKKWFEYNSHLSNMLIPLKEWTSSGYDYPLSELQKFNTLLVDNQQYIKNNRILDLGCSSGYISFIANHLGASSITGLNARSSPIEVANYFFDQCKIPSKFIVGNIEDFKLLKKLCDTTDTVILSSVLEHLRNPECVIRTITNSSVQNILIESSIIEDSLLEPKLYYYTHDSTYEFNAFDDNKTKTLGSCPNQRFLEVILYYHGWKITNYTKYDSFSSDWFGIEKLDTVPVLRKIVVISATKFIK